jgi:hypothetical protein
MAGEPDLGMWLYILRQTLERSLALLAEARGLDWLSEFESELVQDIKNTDIGGVPMTSETVMVERAIQFLNSIFDGARRQIAEESEND